MISQIKTRLSALIGVSALTLTCLLTTLSLGVNITEAAVCYVETGQLEVRPATHTCPPESSTAIYPNGVSNVANLPNSRCFVAPESGPEEPMRYRELDCTALEQLRRSRVRVICETAGGNVVSDEITGMTCQCPDGNIWNGSKCNRIDSNTDFGEPAYVEDDCSGPNIRAGLSEDDPNHCGILTYLVIFINVLSAFVGLIVIGSIIYGGIQYSAAGSDAQMVSTAKNRIRNAIIALLFFIFTYSLLNYLIPGGVL